MAGRIEPATTKVDVHRRLSQYFKVVPARFIVSDDQTTWYVMNPSRLGAQERVLTLQFNAKGILLHRRLRTADSESTIPEDAPRDF